MDYTSYNHIDDNRSMITLGVSWNLFKGKRMDANKKLNNRDNDKGTF